jgi:flavodoxin
MVRIICYSRSGNTLWAAKQLADALGSEIVRIEEENPRGGFIGFFLAGMDATFKRAAKIKPVEIPDEPGSLFVICGPVWAGKLSSPIRALINRLSGKKIKTAYLITRGDKSNPYSGVFDEMDRVIGTRRLAELSLQGGDFKEAATAQLRGFAEGLSKL